MTKKLKTTALRLKPSTLEYIGKVSKMLKLDRSATFRMILEEGIEVDRKERTLELYTKGKASLESAANFADMHIGEFLELMRERGIESNITLDMVKKGLENLKKVRRKEN